MVVCCGGIYVGYRIQAKENMRTDWQLIRELMNAVIDACETVENLDLTDEERNTPLITSPANVCDAIQSSWIYPENVRYEIIRVRHELGNDKHYTPESARALVNAADICAEMIGAGEAQPIKDSITKLAQWYPTYMVPQIANAIETKRKSPHE
ncbi:hypothetical protein IAD21_03453 [Abditibacteriota bacterium]|nr:hypothetical protein IAD21_03453 [Abditibacteriota bacterium]